MFLRFARFLAKGDSPLLIAPRYIGDPKATAAAFTPDGWYKSGDIARREGEYYFIQGRASIDSKQGAFWAGSKKLISTVLKSGGYKISALDIEREILGLDYISEVVVVGVDDEEFGQKVAAAVVLRSDVSYLLCS